MFKILELLKTHKCLQSYEVLDYKQGPTFYYIKIKTELIDKSLLFIREFVSNEVRLYSHHWQKSTGELVIRWDNAPHHRNLKTYPHHKHNPELEESESVNLKDVLDEITKLIF